MSCPRHTLARLPWLVGLVLAAFLVGERPARASACCGSSYGLGSRLAPAETGTVTLLLRGAAPYASWSRTTEVKPSSVLTQELRLDVGGIIRATEHLQLGASAPLVVTRRAGPKGSSVGGGLGDATLFARYDVIPVGGQAGLPGVGLVLGATIPSGRAGRDATDVLGADATGQGLWELRPGVMLERVWLNGFFAVLGASLALRAPVTEGGQRVVMKPRLQLVAAAGPTLARKVSLALGVIHEQEPGPEINGVVAPLSERMKTSLLAVSSVELGPHWSLIFTAQAEPPLRAFGRNEDVGFAVAAGLRHVWLEFE
ncbi:MAG: hypothetical protein AB2A00_35030 [Myxococcota bacterium]